MNYSILLILAIALFMLWDNWQVYRGGTSMIFQHEAKKTDSNAGLPEVPIETAVPAENETATPVAAAAETAKTVQEKQAEVVTITTDVLKARVTSDGGVFQYLELLHYPDTVDPEKDMVLFDMAPHGFIWHRQG